MDSSRPKDVDSEGKSDMKDAVSFLLRGGSLLGAPCTICSGVQIKVQERDNLHKLRKTTAYRRDLCEACVRAPGQ